MPVCIKCNKTLSAYEFYENEHCKSGRMSECKRCHNGGDPGYRDKSLKEKRQMQKDLDTMAHEYCKEHPVETWDDDMILELYNLLKISDKAIPVHAINNKMEAMASWVDPEYKGRKRPRKEAKAKIDLDTVISALAKRFVRKKNQKRWIEERR